MGSLANVNSQGCRGIARRVQRLIALEAGIQDFLIPTGESALILPSRRPNT